MNVNVCRNAKRKELDEVKALMAELHQDLARLRSAQRPQAWLPDGESQIFRIICVWPFGLLDYGSATLHCKI